MVCTGPDIAYAVRVVSQFMMNLEAQCNAVKWIVRYLKGTFRAFLSFGSTMYCKALQMHIMMVMQFIGSLLLIT
jgi:hypothetical protein